MKKWAWKQLLLLVLFLLLLMRFLLGEPYRMFSTTKLCSTHRHTLKLEIHSHTTFATQTNKQTVREKNMETKQSKRKISTTRNQITTIAKAATVAVAAIATATIITEVAHEMNSWHTDNNKIIFSPFFPANTHTHTLTQFLTTIFM